VLSARHSAHETKASAVRTLEATPDTPIGADRSPIANRRIELIQISATRYPLLAGALLGQFIYAAKV